MIECFASTAMGYAFVPVELENLYFNGADLLKAYLCLAFVAFPWAVIKSSILWMAFITIQTEGTKPWLLHIILKAEYVGS